MSPDNSYKKLQVRIRSVLENSDTSGERCKIEKQLEMKFMEAWGLAHDRLRLGCKLANAVRIFSRKDGGCVRGLDHCTYYTGPYDQRIIVTQPYGSTLIEIQEDLNLGNGICPEIVDATEWAFYYPGHASMFIVKFPFGFAEQMKRTRRQWDNEEKQQLLEQAVKQYSEVA